MKIYSIVITEEIKDNTEDYNSKRKIELNFLSNELRNRYLDGYLYPFLRQFARNKEIWIQKNKSFDVLYSFIKTEKELEIITDIPLLHERAKKFDNNKMNKYIKSTKSLKERREIAINNPLQHFNENSSPYRFNIHFKTLDIY